MQEKGKRKKKGLYKSKNGILMNTDLNGFLNILKKYLLNEEYERSIQLNNAINRNISYKDLIKNQTLNKLYEDISILLL